MELTAEQKIQRNGRIAVWLGTPYMGFDIDPRLSFMILLEVESYGYSSVIRSAQDDNTVHACWLEPICSDEEVFGSGWCNTKEEAICRTVDQFIASNPVKP